MTETVELVFQGGQMRFSAGHFTIFSAEKRERLHGHNYHLAARVTAEVMAPGMTFDYDVFRQKLIDLCQQLHSRFLIAGDSPYLTITEDAQYYRVTFAGETMPFLKNDVLILPITNITIEALSCWFVDQIRADNTFIDTYRIRSFDVTVFNGETHGGRSCCQI